MFGFIVTIFDVALYYPLFNALIFIYNYLPWRDFGLAIICLTLIIKFVLYPIAAKALHSQKRLQALQSQLKDIQREHKADKERQARETLELYKREKINPFGGLFLALIQLPILIALYRVFWNGLKPEQLQYLYGFVANPGNINTMFLGFLDLSKPNILFAVLAAVLQFFQTKMLMPEVKKGNEKYAEVTAMMQNQMIYFFPLITIIVLWNLPSALSLYWIVSGLFSIAQQYYLLKPKNDDQPGTGK